jgi:hypothetical protein
MPFTSRPAIRFTPRRFSALTAGIALAAVCLLSAPTSASASSTQIAMIQDGTQLGLNPSATLQRFRLLGATTVRVIVFWYAVAKNPGSRKAPSGFNATDPNAYPAANWAPYDTIVRDAKQDGLTVDFTVAGGAPAWAVGPGVPKNGIQPHYAWKPSAKDYGQFVRAVGKRYSGTFKPKGQSSALPAVHFWAIWNEPNFGEDLGPQAIDGSTVSVAPGMYRGLVNAAWSALAATGHGRDTILIGEFAARGIGPGRPTRNAPQGYPGNYGQTKPLQFIRTLYCVNGSYQPLRGSSAAALGCPTTAAASRRFRAQNPGLFKASGVGDHPYGGNQPPTTDGNTDPDFAAFPDIPNLERVLDRVNKVYGSGTRFPIYSDEYGYITHPPATNKWVSPTTAAYYLNWAEYLSWRNPRIKSYMQFLLVDPKVVKGNAGFASGLLTSRGAQKATYPAYRLPLYLPVTSSRVGRSLEVWGDARPAHFAQLDTTTGQTAQIQFQPGSRGAFTTLSTVNITNSGGYFDVHVKFPRSGTVRLAWTYPKTDPFPFLPVSSLGSTVFSRSVQITLQ